MNRNDPFHSSKGSVAWAKQHIANFDLQANVFLDSKAYAQVTEDDPNSNQKILKYKLIKPMPVGLARIAVDAINNLRAALDQAMFALGGGKVTYFPIRDSAAELDTAIRSLSKYLPNEITALVRSFKPYKRRG